jgi:hypothetical protein
MPAVARALPARRDGPSTASRLTHRFSKRDTPLSPPRGFGGETPHIDAASRAAVLKRDDCSLVAPRNSSSAIAGSATCPAEILALLPVRPHRRRAAADGGAGEIDDLLAGVVARAAA